MVFFCHFGHVILWQFWILFAHWVIDGHWWFLMIDDNWWCLIIEDWWLMTNDYWYLIIDDDSRLLSFTTDADRLLIFKRKKVILEKPRNQPKYELECFEQPTCRTNAKEYLWCCNASKWLIPVSGRVRCRFTMLVICLKNKLMTSSISFVATENLSWFIGTG
jgi:hypothetical protein